MKTTDILNDKNKTYKLCMVLGEAKYGNRGRISIVIMCEVQQNREMLDIDFLQPAGVRKYGVHFIWDA